MIRRHPVLRLEIRKLQTIAYQLNLVACKNFKLGFMDLLRLLKRQPQPITVPHFTLKLALQNLPYVLVWGIFLELLSNKRQRQSERKWTQSLVGSCCFWAKVGTGNCILSLSAARVAALAAPTGKSTPPLPPPHLPWDTKEIESLESSATMRKKK